MFNESSVKDKKNARHNMTDILAYNTDNRINKCVIIAG
jgi:hypothetical protein